MIIDLRSDTLTRPSERMIVEMVKASAGDDSYGENPTVRELEKYCAETFGKDDAAFMVSGTMSNQIAIRAMTSPGDEVISHAACHVNFFEAAQTAALSGVALCPIGYLGGPKPDDDDTGILHPADLDRAIASKARWSLTYATPRLVVIENTVNATGGTIFPLAAMAALREAAHRLGMAVYLDGARLLNACVATGVAPREYAAEVDALSVCFAKGLGAPFGAMLMGTREFIVQARKFRKWYGGGLHQSGYMAAAALYAIRNNVERLVSDHRAAHRLYEIVTGTTKLRAREPQTNLVMLECGHLGTTAAAIVAAAHQSGVELIAWSPTCVRAVTSMSVTTRTAETAAQVVAHVMKDLQGNCG
jgi:threonine aldolase